MPQGFCQIYGLLVTLLGIWGYKNGGTSLRRSDSNSGLKCSTHSTIRISSNRTQISATRTSEPLVRLTRREVYNSPRSSTGKRTRSLHSDPPYPRGAQTLGRRWRIPGRGKSSLPSLLRVVSRKQLLSNRTNLLVLGGRCYLAVGINCLLRGGGSSAIMKNDSSDLFRRSTSALQ